MRCIRSVVGHVCQLVVYETFEISLILPCQSLVLSLLTEKANGFAYAYVDVVIHPADIITRLITIAQAPLIDIDQLPALDKGNASADKSLAAMEAAQRRSLRDNALGAADASKSSGLHCPPDQVAPS